MPILLKNLGFAIEGDILREASIGCTVVYDSATSEGLHEFLEQPYRLGMSHIPYTI